MGSLGRTSRGRDERRSPAAEIALAALVLSYGAVSQKLVPARWQLPANLAAAAGALAAARGAGASWRELGLEPSAAPDGLRFGLATVPPVGAAVALALASPATRQFFTDERVGGSSDRELAYHAFVHIPLATVITEELLFRSAVFGVTTHRSGSARAVALTSVVFGLWHVVPALHSHAANPAGARVAERVGGRSASVVATVAATALAGSAFAWLRLRSRSVIAPIVAHAAVNVAGLIAARWVERQEAASGR